METVFDFDVVFITAGGADVTLRRCIVEVERNGLVKIKPKDGGGIHVTHLSNILGLVLPPPKRNEEQFMIKEIRNDEIPF